MPIVRQNETGSRLAPSSLYLWNRKWWILIPTVAMFFLTYFVMLFVKQDFTVSSEVYVNRLAVLQDNQASPNTVAGIARSAPLLYKVREVFMKKYPQQKPKLEDFVKQFRVRQETLQDTSVRKEVSPVLFLTVQATGREETKFLMETWLRTLVEEYGNFATEESSLRLELLKHEDARIEAQLLAAETERARYAAAMPRVRKFLAEQLNVLAPSELRMQEPAAQLDARDNARNMNMQIELPSVDARVGSGVLADLANTRMELLWLEANQGTTSTQYTELRREFEVLSRVVDEMQTSIAATQAELADLQQKSDTVSRRILLMSGQQNELRAFMDKVATVAALYSKVTTGSLPVGGDFRALSMPVLPELRVWPKRTLISLVVALATFVICIAALKVYHQMRESARDAIHERRLG